MKYHHACRHSSLWLFIGLGFSSYLQSNTWESAPLHCVHTIRNGPHLTRRSASQYCSRKLAKKVTSNLPDKTRTSKNEAFSSPSYTQITPLNRTSTLGKNRREINWKIIHLKTFPSKFSKFTEIRIYRWPIQVSIQVFEIQITASKNLLKYCFSILS